MVLLKVAWRNVWRNKTRSGVVVVAVMLGVWSLIFALAFMNGFFKSYLSNAINKDFSHVQIHSKAFLKDGEVGFVLDNFQEIKKALEGDKTIASYSYRLKTNGMIASAKAARGVDILGVDTIREDQLTRVQSDIVEGNFLGGIKRNPIVIGRDLANKLKVKIRSKVVLTFRDKDGELVAASFRVAGIMESVSVKKNELTAYVLDKDVRNLLKLGPEEFHEIALLCKEEETVETLRTALQQISGNNEVASWRTLAPELEVMQSQSKISLGIIVGIIMLALCFGIINTMLMAVLERFKEIGMLMAIGMKKSNVFAMIVYETMMLSIIGGPFGLFLGWASNTALKEKGIDLSSYSDGLDKMGIDSILRPSLEQSDYMFVVFSVMIMAVLAAIFPARRAIKLDPIEALHKI